MRFHVFSVLAGHLLFLALFGTSAKAQYWTQTVQLTTTVRHGEPLDVVIDSLDAFLTQNPTTPVRRTAHDSGSIPFHALREKLHDDGVDMWSTTHLLVTYRFDLGRQWRLVETIEHISFVYREDDNQTEFALLHVDFSTPAIGDFLQTRVMRSPLNMNSVTNFRQVLSFLELGRDRLRAGALPSPHSVLSQLLSEGLEISPTAYLLETKGSTVAGAVSPPENLK